MQRRKRSPEAHLGTLHMATGESFHVQQLRLPGRSYGRVFSTNFHEETAKLARGISSAPTLRVMLILPSMLDYQAWRRLDQVKVGAELGIDHSSVSRALAQLLAIGFVEKRGRGPLIEWRLSSDYGWKGSVDAFHQFRRSKGETTKAELTDLEIQRPQKGYYANSCRWSS